MGNGCEVQAALLLDGEAVVEVDLELAEVVDRLPERIVLLQNAAILKNLGCGCRNRLAHAGPHHVQELVLHAHDPLLQAVAFPLAMALVHEAGIEAGYGLDRVQEDRQVRRLVGGGAAGELVADRVARRRQILHDDTKGLPLRVVRREEALRLPHPPEIVILFGLARRTARKSRKYHHFTAA